jgi:hypothetical protein
MADVAGPISGYLNKRQMTALNVLCEERNVFTSQVVKEMVVKGLVEEGLLPESELTTVRQKQAELAIKPSTTPVVPVAKTDAERQAQLRRTHRRRRLGN